MSVQIISINTDIFKDEDKLREFIGLVPNRMIGAGSKINSFSKDFIRETWKKVKWMEIFHYWYIRYRDKHLITFNDFMQIIDPKREFWKPGDF